MGVGVDSSGEQQATSEVNFVIGLSAEFIGGIALDHLRYHFAVNQHAAEETTSVVNYLGIVNQRLAHCIAHCFALGYFLNQLEIFSLITPNTASEKIPELILLVPSTRFTNMIGTSLMVNPHFNEVNFISIWKA